MTFMTTKAQRRARAKAANADLVLQFARQNEGGADLDGAGTDYERLKRATMREAQRESAAEAAAQREKDLAPVYELQKAMTAERIEARRRARVALATNRDYP